jgi:hypothetical protein
VIQIDQNSGTITGTATMSRCVAPGHPDIHSGTVSISGHTTLLTAVPITATTTNNTITWNTGESTTETQIRTFTGAASVA